MKYVDHIFPIKAAMNLDGLANRLPKLSCKSDLDGFYLHIPYEPEKSITYDSYDAYWAWFPYCGFLVPHIGHNHSYMSKCPSQTKSNIVQNGESQMPCNLFFLTGPNIMYAARIPVYGMFFK